STVRRPQARAQPDGLRRPPHALARAPDEASRGPRRAEQAVAPRARRRVPGHEPAAVRDRRGDYGGGRQPDGGGRRLAVDLLVPRRELLQHYAVTTATA